MIIKIELLEQLRMYVKQNKQVNQLISLIENSVDYEDFNSFLVMYYFMQAFNLSFSQVKELPGAFCMGGGVYTDKEINDLIYQQIKKTKEKYSFLHCIPAIDEAEDKDEE